MRKRLKLCEALDHSMFVQARRCSFCRALVTLSDLPLLQCMFFLIRRTAGRLLGTRQQFKELMCLNQSQRFVLCLLQNGGKAFKKRN